MPQTFNCPRCNAPLDYDGGDDLTIRCPFCNNSVIVPETLRTPKTEPLPAPEAASLKDQIVALNQVARLVRAGNKIEAIKLYRETFRVGLKDAKDAVEKLEAGQPVTMTNFMVETSGAMEPAFAPSAPLLTPAARRAGCASFGGIGVVGLLLPILGLLVGLAAAVYALLPASLRAATGDFARQFTGDAPVALRFGGEGAGPGLFDDARSIAVDGDGHIYVGDYQDGRVQVFDASGKFVTQWMVNTETPLTGLAAERDGTVYVVQGGEIYRYAGATGKLLGQVEYAEGWGFDDVVVTADGGLVAAWYKNRDDIVRFDREGRVVTTIREAISSASGDSELDTRVAVDGLGNIYALGMFNSAVFKFAPEGQFVSRFGGEGDEPGQFRAPYAIAVDGQGRVYVSDIKGIQVFDADGRYLKLIRVEGAVFGMTFNDQNELFVVSNAEQVIKLQVN